MIIIGIDGMDPTLLRRFMEEGKMPAFKKLVESGYFGRLGTTMPPQSPVAWSSFITGTNPGGHGIYDFVHRDAASFSPYLSTSRSFPAKHSLDWGKWSLPLGSGHVDMMRRGTPFWSHLEKHDIWTSLSELPANFPVSESPSFALSGMGTPDLLGTYGTFTYFSDREVPGSEKFTGGRVVKVKVVDHKVKTKLGGPNNPLRNDDKPLDIEFTVNRDPWEPMIRINMQDKEIILRQGEWSEWIPIRFEVMPMFSSISGMVKFYAQEVHPRFKLYVSPINIDPMEPTLPICSPAGYSRELSQAIGRFHTKGFPEDTKALSHGIFSNEEFLSQSKQVLEERLKVLDYEFSRFHEGLFFFYFSSVDQNSHMMYRFLHPEHHLYEPDASQEAKEAMAYFYSRMDEVLRQILAKVDSRTVLMFMSDHGFAPFEREFHISTWLVENGYMVLTQPDRMHESEFYNFVDWSKTKAYAMGLNGIYINLEGRDKYGSVTPDKAQGIKQEIMARLANVRDPKNGKPVITQTYDSRQIYSGPYLSMSPDIVVGYHSGYRISDEAVLGKFPKGILGDREDKWSADHCMDPAVVPGVLVANRPIKVPEPALWDLAPTILKAFGIEVPKEMDGKPVLEA